MRPVEIAAWLLTYALHSTLLLGLAALLTLRRRRSAVVDDVLWKAALVGGLVTATLPSLVGFAPAGGSVQLATTPVTSDAGLGTRRSSVPVAPTAPATERTAPDRTPSPAAVETMSGTPLAAAEARRPSTPIAPETFLLALWAGVALLGLARLAGAHVRLRRLLGPRRPLRDPALAAEVESLRRAAGIRSPVRLTTAPGLVSPVALGRREICLPHAVLTELGREQQRSVLAHEVAHLARRDPLWLALATVLERLFPFQPLNRLARRRLQESAEYLCDDWAARHAGSGLVVAKSLLKVAEWMEAGATPAPVPLAGMAESPSQLVARVRRLVEQGTHRPTVRAGRLALAAVVLLLGAAMIAPAVTGAAAAQVAEPDVDVPDVDVPEVDAARTQDTTDSARLRALLGALRDSDAGVRRAAARSLGNLEDARAVDGLAAALGDGDAEVRTAAAHALGEIGDRRAVRPLVARLDAARGEERMAIVHALGELEDPAAAPALARVLADERAELREAAAHALGDLELRTAPPELLAALSDPDPGVRHAAVHAVGDIEDPRAVPAFRKILADPASDVKLRLAAVEALDDIHTPEAVQGLLDAMKSGSPLVRRAAADALGERR